MEQTGVVKLAKVLKVLVTLTFICNLIVLPLVPGLVGLRVAAGEGYLLSKVLIWMPLIAAKGWSSFSFWLANPVGMVLAGFLMFCGACTTVILWQARGVLDTIVRQNTFTKPNAKRIKVAAISCFLIGSAALARTVWGFFFYKSIQPLFTYNALFIPTFLMAGLLCMVMSALFRQAAELKEESDLTI